MTSNTKQFRAVFLAALMVMSVFAGTIAFAGSAAAVTGGSADNLDPSTIDENTQQQHTFNVSYDNYKSDSSTDTVKVNLPDGVTLDSQSLTIKNATSGSEISATVSTSNNDISADFSQSAGENTTLYVNGTFTITAPSVTSDTTKQVYFNLTDANDGTQNLSKDLKIVNDADSPEYLESVVYEEGGQAKLEIAFDEDLKDSTLDFELYEDEKKVDSFSGSPDAGTGGHVVYNLNKVYTGDVTLKVSKNIEDTSSNKISNDGNKTVDVAPVTVTKGDDLNAYKGSNLAVIAGTTNTDVIVQAGEDEDFDAFQDGSTGTNSKVYVFSTNSDTNTGQYNITIGDKNYADVNIRDLGLEVNVDDLNVTTEDEITGTVEADAGDRPITVELLDSDGDTVEERGARLSGQAKYEFTFNASEDKLDLDADNYTILATDNQSGVEAESSSVVVSKAGEGETSFTGERLVMDERGDVANITINVENADYATLSIGNDDLAFESNVTIEDVNGDGQVSLLFNTYAATGKSGKLPDDGGVVYSTPSLEDQDDDKITSATIEQGVNSLLEAGRYPLEVRAGQDKKDDSEAAGTLELTERNTTSIQTWTAPKDTTFDDTADLYDAIENNNLTQSNKVAFGDSQGDVVVHELKASGLEGLLMAQSNDDVTDKFFAEDVDTGAFELTLEQVNPGANRESYTLNLSKTNATVWSDSDNDTYFIRYDTDEVTTTEPGRSLDYGHTLEANFTVYEDEGNLTDADDGETVTGEYELVEADYTIDDPYNVSNAAGQTITGETTLAPGTELSIRARSTGDTQPSFLKPSTVYVTENRTFSATVDFSEQAVGDTYEITIDGGAADSVTVDGNVVESPETPTTDTPSDNESTATPTTDTPTTDTPSDTTTEPSETTTESSDEGTETGTESSTPGFGVVVAVTALLAAALLAVRRD
ncbi:BGTF surface domain-containing protein [Halogeometricum borinquense]|uniref:BGTF surface domain-containing protein n=1 Tax=Halogeometricum borinquense TaxID=60847 RepID=UPI003444EB7C